MILGVSVICAPTEEEAEYHAASTDLGVGAAHGASSRRCPSPEEAIAYHVFASGACDRGDQPSATLHRHAVQGREHDSHLVEDTGADEIMVTSMMYGRVERLRSYELLAGEWGINQNV